MPPNQMISQINQILTQIPPEVDTNENSDLKLDAKPIDEVEIQVESILNLIEKDEEVRKEFLLFKVLDFDWQD